MKKLLIFIAICVVVLPSCGAKKNVATNVESTPSETEANEVVTSADTLPDFLREFANDSTIHINWVYGIPFVIDDSVPMFLPPIDKNPEGYVSSDAFSRGISKGLKIFGIFSPVDSILWLNKCLNDIHEYLKETHPGPYSFESSHEFSYVVRLVSIRDQIYVNIIYVQYQQFMQSPELANYIISYFFDLEGNLLGKMHVQVPKLWPHPLKDPIFLRTYIPNYNLFQEECLSGSMRQVISQLVYYIPQDTRTCD